MILKKIKQHLVAMINTHFIHIDDNSKYHNRSKNNLTHITIILVSDDFINQKLVNRHRMIFLTLLKIKKIYSLTLHTYTVDEWQKKQYQVNNHSNCFKKK